MERRIGASSLARLLGEPKAHTPAYAWLAGAIERLIVDGRLLHDTRLPGERELAKVLELSRTTVTHAYKQLSERGFAEAVQGSGTRVRVPGGEVFAGAEPLLGVDDDACNRDVPQVNLTNASPPAMPGLSAYYADAVEQLGAYSSGGGYFGAGIPLLRKEIAALYTAQGAPTDADQIIVTTGALSGISAIASALIGRRDIVASERTGYPNSLAAIRSRGARYVPVEGAAELTSQLHHRVPSVMMAIPDFHNPTGVLMDDAERADLAGLWKKHNILGIVDETSRDLWWDESVAAAPMAAYAPDCLSVGSASKTYWGGLRIGWIRAPKKLIGAILRARLTQDLGAPVLEQLVSSALLNQAPGLDAERRETLRRRRIWLRNELIRVCPGWECQIPAGGLSLWWHLPTPCSTELANKAGHRGVTLPAGSAFSLDGHGLEHWIRTPFTASAEELQIAVDVLRESFAEIAGT